MSQVAVQQHELPRSERNLYLWFIGIGFAHLMVGLFLGFMQGMQHAGIDLYRTIPIVRHYYQGLTAHGVFNVMIFTTFFIAALLLFVTRTSLKKPLNLKLGWTTFWVMTVGVILVDYSIFTNQASVLYTAYSPLQAHWTFYLGLALVVVGTWLQLLIIGKSVLEWRKENAGQRTPLLAFGALATLLMWGLASIPLAILFVGILLPWSLDLIPGVDVLFNRTLFWMSGHPLVYFWLLPAYVVWYFMLPRQVGGKLFSEPLARLSFLLFIPLSLPVGFHHQYVDPGVAEGYKFVHAILTFAVFMPSAITAFTVLASVETGGRARGGKGLFGWIQGTSVERPVRHGYLVVHGSVRFGRRQRLAERVVHDEPYHPQHVVRTWPLPLDGRYRYRVDVHGCRVLARALLDGPSPAEPAHGCHPGLALVRRHGDHVSRHELGRYARCAASDGARCSPVLHGRMGTAVLVHGHRWHFAHH